MYAQVLYALLFHAFIILPHVHRCLLFYRDKVDVKDMLTRVDLV